MTIKEAIEELKKIKHHEDMFVIVTREANDVSGMVTCMNSSEALSIALEVLEAREEADSYYTK